MTISKLSFYVIFLAILVGAYGRESLIDAKLAAHPLLAKRIRTWIAQLENRGKEQQARKNLLRIGRIAAPFLYQNLAKKDINSKKKILDILRYIDPTGCPPVLLRILADESEPSSVREQAAVVLGHLKETKALGQLAKWVSGEDQQIDKAAAYAICRIGGKESIPYLIALLRHRDKDIVTRAHSVLTDTTKENKPLEFTVWQQWWNDYQEIWEDNNK